MSDGLALDEALIRRLAALLEETGLREIEVGEGTRHVRVARGPAAPAAPAEAPPGPALAPAAETAASEPPADAAERPVKAGDPGAVASPMVGTLYVAPSPGERPYVVEGAAVTEGDTMFIIEAMKTMNPVRAPRSGTVARILAGDSSPVEYGQVLAVIA